MRHSCFTKIRPRGSAEQPSHSKLVKSSLEVESANPVHSQRLKSVPHLRDEHGSGGHTAQCMTYTD